MIFFLDYSVFLVVDDLCKSKRENICRNIIEEKGKMCAGKIEETSSGSKHRGFNEVKRLSQPYINTMQTGHSISRSHKVVHQQECIFVRSAVSCQCLFVE